MRRFFERYMDNLDDQDAIQYIKRRFDNYARGDRSSSSGGGGSSHMGGENKMQELAIVYEMLTEFFESQGLDPRSFLGGSEFDGYTRGGGRGR